MYIFTRLRIILLFCFCSGFLPAQNKDSLWGIWLDNSRADTVRINAIDWLCLIMQQESNNDSSLKLADIAYAYSKKVKREKYAIRSLLRKADAYCDFEETRVKAFQLYQQTLALGKKYNYDNAQGASLNNIGTIYLNWGDYANAIHYYYEGLKVIERRKDSIQRVAALSNIADIYSKVGNCDSAITIAKRLVTPVAKEHRIYTSLLKTISDIYQHCDQDDSAFHYLKLVVERREKMKDIYGLRHSYMDMALHFLNDSLANLPEARKYTAKSRKICEQISDSISIGKCMAMEAIITYDEGKKDLALPLLEKAIPVLAKNTDKRDLLEMTGKLAKWYKEKGNFKKAYALNETYKTLKDSIGSNDAKNALYLEQLKYATEKKAILEKAETDKKLAEIREAADKKDFQKTIWLVIAGAVLVVVIVLTILLYYHYKQKNTIQSQKNDLMKRQLLIAQMNPHFIFNSLNAVQNYIYKQDSYQAGIYLKQFSELIRMILDFSTKELISLEDEYQFLKNYLELQQLRFDGSFRFELNIDPELERDLIMIPPMMAQPFIENAIEHGLQQKKDAEEGFLSVRLSMKEHQLLYEIEDNGVGLAEAMRLKQKLGKKHESLAISITRERLQHMSAGDTRHYDIEIKDKRKSEKSSSGVYVKFVTPFLSI
ncbi:MAG: histidine kinase [Bacteroidia bacterium]|nr:histidine kinase [Bacteroidia bacterium]